MPKGRPAGCASQRRLRCDPCQWKSQWKSHWLRAAPYIRLSHTTHLAMKVRHAARPTDSPQRRFIQEPGLLFAVLV